MIELARELFFFFSLETGILGVVKENENFLIVTLIVVAVMLFFFGFKIYRAIFSVLIFMTATLVIIFIMKGQTDWGTITTTFEVLGSILAFFAYRWHILGGYCISIFSGITTAWVYTQSMMTSILVGVLVGITMSFLPVITLCLTTTLWGWVVLQEFSLFEDIGMFLLLIILVIGFGLQVLMNKNQVLFEKPYPEMMIQWIDERR